MKSVTNVHVSSQLIMVHEKIYFDALVFCYFLISMRPVFTTNPKPQLALPVKVSDVHKLLASIFHLFMQNHWTTFRGTHHSV